MLDREFGAQRVRPALSGPKVAPRLNEDKNPKTESETQSVEPKMVPAAGFEPAPHCWD